MESSPRTPTHTPPFHQFTVPTAGDAIRVPSHALVCATAPCSPPLATPLGLASPFFLGTAHLSREPLVGNTGPPRHPRAGRSGEGDEPGSQGPSAVLFSREPRWLCGDGTHPHGDAQGGRGLRGHRGPLRRHAPGVDAQTPQQPQGQQDEPPPPLPPSGTVWGPQRLRQEDCTCCARVGRVEAHRDHCVEAHGVQHVQTRSGVLAEPREGPP